MWRQRGYAWLFGATAVSAAGTALTQLAMSVLAVETLDASPVELGVLRAAQWVPYLVLGVVVGALVDRVRRTPVLVGADLARAVLLGLVPLLALLDRLSIPVLAAVVAGVGLATVAHDAADQSSVPRLVPARLLTRANARLEQTTAVAQSVGPLTAGGLVAWIGATATIAVDAVSYLLSAVLVSRARLPAPPRTGGRRPLRREIREGVRWVYGHPGLRPMSVNVHGWFLFNSMGTTIYVLLALRTLDLGAVGLGLTMALAGVGGVVGGAVSGRAERRFGVGGTLILERWLSPVVYALLAVAPAGGWGLVMACVAQFLYGVVITIASPMEVGYRQSVTPDRLLARATATVRSLNWGMIAVGAPLGGLLAERLGNRHGLWPPVAGLAVVALLLTVSRVRRIRSLTDVPR